MPTYQYACTACGEQLEVVQSFTDAALTECPACGGALRKVFSAVGVVFKGSGFYKTDSRTTSTAAGVKTESKTDAKGESKSEGATKSDAKPAAATTPDSSSSSTKSTPAAKTA